MMKDTVIVLDAIEFVITIKSIKNLYIRVKKDKKAYVSVPKRFTKAHMHDVLHAHLPWVKAQLEKLADRPKSVVYEYLTGETHYLWGKGYRLVVEDNQPKHSVCLNNDEIYVYTKGKLTREQRAKLLDLFHREQLTQVIPNLMATWERRMDVKASEWRLKTMKTRWGTCNTRDKRIWLNTELAKYPFECFEYVLVHELVHLLERSHNHRFHALMSQFLPDWPDRKKALNHLAIKLH